MRRKLRWYDLITVNIFYFALTTRSQTLAIIVPLLVQEFVGEATKGTALGNIRLWGLMIAVLFQAVAGILSDRNTARIGRRRPFMLIGAVTEVMVFIAIGVIAARMEGQTGYWVLFGAYVLSMLSANTGHAAVQGLIPDIVPQSKHGLYSGVKAFFELPAPLIFVSFVISRMVGNDNIWGALIVLSGVVLVCTAIAMAVPEKPISKPPYPMDWAPILRLVLMTGAFTAIILGAGALVNFVNQLTSGLSDTLRLILTAGMGVLGMALAVILGVWASIRISVGEKGDQSNRSFTWWVVNRLAFLVGSNNISIFAIYFLQERFADQAGVAVEEIFGRIILFVGLAIFISSIPAGWLTDKFGRKILCFFSGVLATFGTLVLILSVNTGLLYVGSVLIGIAIGFFYAASWALGTTLVPPQEAGRYLGIQNLAGAGAGAIGAYIGGPIGDNVGFTLLMGVFGLLFIISTLALFGIKEKTVEVWTEVFEVE
jgi:MFS family permease